MDIDDLDPIDILAFTTDELRNSFAGAKNVDEQNSIMMGFLQSWDADPALKNMKKLEICFEKDLDWFNVSQPLTIEGLRGKLVILDFFTYCCINCMHVFPELKAIEERFSVADGLVVVGVHSPKFENEKDSSNILSAIQRYNIQHPIANDPCSILWNVLHIKCWPTLLVLGPSGAPLLMLMGEGHRSFLEHFLDQALQYFDKKNQIKNFEIPVRLSTNLTPASQLNFPAKIACLPLTESEDSSLFAIADAGNNRILVIDSNGVVLHRIGGCESGFVDGDFSAARFHAPQGVAFIDANTLVVADTENHAIRQIMLSSGEVITLVGTGKQGNDRIGGKIGTLQEISSPWDVTVFRTRDMDMSFHIDEQKVHEKTIILIAMAGTHQIWGYFPEGVIWWKFKKFEPLTCCPLIGNGMEENRNNSYPQNAAFAQPSGLAMANEFLYIADSESSSVRKASMVDGKVMAVVGGDRNPLNLFAFGDIDGKQYNAKMQHPLGVAYNHRNKRIYVADTYNHKIKSIDIETNTIETCCVKDATQKQAVYQFNEPAGVCCDASGQRLLVADTNNHCIQVIDLNKMQAQRLKLDFSKQLVSILETRALHAASNMELRSSLPLYGCKMLDLKLNLDLEDSLKFTSGAPQMWKCHSSHFTLLKDDNSLQNGVCKMKLQRLDNEVDAAQTEEIKLNFTLNLCDTNSCLVKRFTLILSNCDSKTKVERSISQQLNLNISKNNVKLS